VDSYEGKTPALGDHQARALLHAPDAETVKGKRDRAILSMLLYHGLRREELTTLVVKDPTQWRGVPHVRVHGKGGKTRYVPMHPGTAELVTDYREALGHDADPAPPLFRPIRNNVRKRTDTAMTTDGVYKLVRSYTRNIGVGDIEGLGVHALRARAATPARDHDAALAKVPAGRGGADMATARRDDRGTHRPEERPSWNGADERSGPSPLSCGGGIGGGRARKNVRDPALLDVWVPRWMIAVIGLRASSTPARRQPVQKTTDGMPQAITALHGRHQLGAILEAVATQRQRFLRKRAGVPAAILLRVPDVEALQGRLDTGCEPQDRALQKSLVDARQDSEAGKLAPIADLRRARQAKDRRGQTRA
jgi:hypothetical protein